MLLGYRGKPIFSFVIEDSDIGYLRSFLREYRLGPTDLTRFLESPEVFLQSVILKYPFEDTPKTLFGTCYHSVLEEFYKNWKNSKIQPSKESLLDAFERRISMQILSPEHKVDALKRGKE